jgi:large subunit ribosomal protein L5
MSRLQKYYSTVLQKDLLQFFNYKNFHEIPFLKVIVVNFGLKDSVHETKNLLPALLALELITNQKGFLTFSKKSIVSLKIRKGIPIGAKVTLRKKSLYFFLDYLITFNLAKLKNFEGFSFKNNFDQQGNFTFSLKDNFIFSILELNYEKFQKFPPIKISITTSTTNIKESIVLLRGFQLPIK